MSSETGVFFATDFSKKILSSQLGDDTWAKHFCTEGISNGSGHSWDPTSLLPFSCGKLWSDLILWIKLWVKAVAFCTSCIDMLNGYVITQICVFMNNHWAIFYLMKSRSGTGLKEMLCFFLFQHWSSWPDFRWSEFFTQEWLCGLRNDTRASIEIWVKFQF